MAFDGLSVYTIVQELSDLLTDGRIDKVYQPEKDEIQLGIRSKQGNKRLLMTCSSHNTRLHLTDIRKENPAHPPMFCMLLRKHIGGGKILAVRQKGFDRIVEFDIEATNEMGDKCLRHLIVEIMGKHSNIIVCDENYRILDSIRHVSPDMSSVRVVLPGSSYMAPPGSDQLNPLEKQSADVLLSTLQEKKEDIFKALFHSYAGFSPVLSQEILTRAQLDSSLHTEELTLEIAEKILSTKEALLEEAIEKHFAYDIYVDEYKMVDFAPVEMLHYDQYERRSFESFSQLLEVFYSQKDQHNRVKQKSQDLRKLLNTLLERALKKKALQEKQLKNTKNKDKFQLYGELITANIYQVKKGMSSFETVNYYDAEGSMITIPLNVNFTASENAQKYFKRYNKLKRTEIASKEQIELTTKEVDYFESLIAALEIAENEHDLMAIRQELHQEGYIKRIKGKSKLRIKDSKPISFVTSEGIEGMIGKNNNQNDQLTFKKARASDLWFHTKDIPGSHVILFVSGKEYTDQSVEEAAILAAYHSKAKNSSKVPVDYTERRQVKKPNGSKPGFVIYFQQKTLFVTPEEELVNKLIQG